MADDKKSPKDTPHIIIEAEATIDDGNSKGEADNGEGNGDTSKPREKSPKKNKSMLATLGGALFRLVRRGFILITFLLATYAIWDNWQVKRDLAQIGQSVETLKLAGEEIAGQNLTTPDRQSIARLLQAISSFSEQIDALNTRLFSMEAEIAGLQTPPAAATPLATPTPTTPLATPTTPPAPVAPSNFSVAIQDPTPKPSLLPLIQAARTDTPFDALLANYLPHYRGAHPLAQWAATPPPSLASLWQTYDTLLAHAISQENDNDSTGDNANETSPSWFGRLIALANTSIRITPLGEAARFDALKHARTTQDLASAMLAVSDYMAATPTAAILSDWQAWLTQADQRVQLETAIASLLNTNTLRGGS